MPRRRSSRRSSRSQPGLGRYLRKPGVQLGILIIVGILIFLIATLGGEQANVATPKTESLPALVDVDEAHQMYQEGTFVLDVRTSEEWKEFHAPDTTLIPLDELPGRLNELPVDQPILVVCRSGNRSQAGRDILLQAGFNATSMRGGLNQWRENGYPVVSGP
jgi:rhodanese-related sulfurtransferase